jgi:hypothetical protein
MGRSYSYEDGEWGLFVLEAYLENEGVRPSLGMAALTERQKDGAKKAARAFTKSALAALPKNGKESLIRRFGGEDGAGFIVHDILSGGGSENQIDVDEADRIGKAVLKKKPLAFSTLENKLMDLADKVAQKIG